MGGDGAGGALGFEEGVGFVFGDFFGGDGSVWGAEGWVSWGVLVGMGVWGSWLWGSWLWGSWLWGSWLWGLFGDGIGGDSRCFRVP